jgi:hypothetical protein
LFNYDALIRNSEIEPDDIWLLLDSFWRHKTVSSTTSLTQYLTYGMLVAFLDNYSLGQHLQTGYNIQRLQTYAPLPWVPLIIYQDELVESSFVAYGEGYDYDPAPQIYYGQAGTITRWVLPVDEKIVAIDGLANEITDPTYWAGPAAVQVNPLKHQLEFIYNPFDFLTPKTSASGRQYIVLWARNVQVNYDLPFDQVGWVVQFQGNNGDSYRKSLYWLWKLIINGPSLLSYLGGLNSALGYPLSEETEIIRAIQTDGWQRIISTDTHTYTGLLSWPFSRLQGDTLAKDDAVFECVKAYEYDALLLSTQSEIPGLLLRFPLSTGVVANLGFANYADAWTFDAGRPSPWRFPISGDPAEVEQFWVDVDTYATANSIDLQTLFGLPAAVNPMKMVIQELMTNKVVVVTAPLALIEELNPPGFHDRALELLPPGTLLILQQDVGSFFDSLDLGTTSSETINYGYHTDAPTEVISVPGGGTDLTYFDYTPFIVTA